MRSLMNGLTMILHLLTQSIVVFVTVNAVAAAPLSDNSVRYRGNYTLGHEVNSFCPQINTQCYWLSPTTPHPVQQQLKALSKQYSTKPYDAICVVIKGRIDRESERKGFAADYDGLVTIDDVYDECSQTNIIIPGDLQHHRWVLSSINNAPISIRQFNTLPILDFGEQMFVAVNDGCRQFSAVALLENEVLIFKQIEMINNACVTDSGLSESLALSEKHWSITIPEHGFLKLQSGELVLDFKLNDWR